MNFFTDWVSDWAGGVAKGFGLSSPGGGAVGPLAGGFAQQVAAPQIAAIPGADNNTKDALSTSINQVVSRKSSEALYEATPYHQVVAPVVTTGFLGGSAALRGRNDLFDDAWLNRRNVSPGQATVIFAADLMPNGLDLQKVDWRNKKDVQEFFDYKNNKAAAIVSGTLDAGYSVGLDPLVLGGGVAGAVRRGTFVRPIRTAEEAIAFTNKIQKSQPGDITPERVFIDSVVNSNSLTELSTKKVILDSSMPIDGARVLWNAKQIAGEQGVKDAASVMFGDRRAYDRLAAKSEILKKQLDDIAKADENALGVLNTPVNELVDQPYWNRAEFDSYKTQSAKIVEELKKEINWLDDVTTGELKPTVKVDASGAEQVLAPGGVFGIAATRTVPKFYWAAKQQSKNDAIRAKTFIDDDLKTSPSGAAVRISSWLDEGGLVNEMAPNWLKVGAATNNQSIKDVYAFVKKAARDAGLGNDKEWKTKHIDAYLAAQSKGERHQWVKAVNEDYQTQILINKFKLDPIVDADKITIARIFSEYLVKQHSRASAGALFSYMKNKYVTIDENGIPLISPQLKEYLKSNTDGIKRLEEMPLSKSELEQIPLYESQIADVVPLMDTQMMKRVLDENTNSIQMLLDSDLHTVKDLPSLEAALKTHAATKVDEGFRLEGYRALDLLQHTLDTYYNIWKPATLMSLRYLSRNITEGSGRVVAMATYLPYLYGENPVSFIGTVGSAAARGVKLGATNFKGNRAAKTQADIYNQMSAPQKLVLSTADGDIKQGLGIIVRKERDIKALQKTINTMAKAKIRDLYSALSSRLDISDRDLNYFTNQLNEFSDRPAFHQDVLTEGEILAERLVNARSQESVQKSINMIVEDTSKITADIDNFLELRGQGYTPKEFDVEISKLKGLLAEETKANTVKSDTFQLPEKFKDYTALAKESKQYKTFADFDKAYSQDIKHGQYYHFTDNPNFTIDALKGPRDMSTLSAAPKAAKGDLMVTSDFDNWNATYNSESLTRPYVAIIDLSDAPKVTVKQTSRGFGNEFYIRAEGVEKAKVVSVLPVDEAEKVFAQYRKGLPQSKEELKTIWDAANKSFTVNETQLIKDLNLRIKDFESKKSLLNPKTMSSRFYKEGLKVSPIELVQMQKMSDYLKEIQDAWIGVSQAHNKRVSVLKDLEKANIGTTYEKQYSAKPFKVEGVMAPSAADGMLGDIMYKQEASGVNTARNYFTNGKIQNSFLNSAKSKSTWDTISPDTPEWFDSMKFYSNEIIRNDSVAKQILTGKSDDQILQWLVKPENKKYLKNADYAIQAFGGGSKSKFVQWLRAITEKTIPEIGVNGVNLRKKLIETGLDDTDILAFPKELRASVPGAELLPGKHTLMDTWNGVTEWLFKYIGSLPEDTLLRHPVYDAVYHMETKRLARLWKGKAGEMTENDFSKINLQSHSRALKTLNENLFTIQRYSNTAGLMRFVSPFYMPSQNSARFWLGRSIQNPIIPGLALQVWNVPNKLFEVYDSNDNNRRITYSYPFTGANEQIWITIPKPFIKAFGLAPGDHYTLAKNSILNLMLNETIINPAFGSVVTVPATALIKKSVGSAFDIDAMLTSVGLPGRYVEQWFLGGNVVSNKSFTEDLFQSNALLKRFKRVWDVSQGKLDPLTNSRVAALNKRFAVEMAQSGQEMNVQVASAISTKTLNMVLRGAYVEAFFYAIGIPAAGSIRNDWQLLQSEHYKYTQNDPLLGSVMFASDYGDEINAVAKGSLNQNVYGLKNNNKTVRNIKELKPFINSILGGGGYDPDKLGLIGSLVNTDSTTFSPVAYNVISSLTLGNRDARDKRNIVDQQRLDDVNIGWSIYMPQKRIIDAEIASGKITKQEGKIQLDAVKEYVASKHDFWRQNKGKIDTEGSQGSVDFVYNTLNNTKVMSSVLSGKDERANLWQGILEWAQFRPSIVKILEDNAAMGNSADINAEQNAALKEVVDEKLTEISTKYSGFGDFYVRFLDNDKYKKPNIDEVPGEFK